MNKRIFLSISLVLFVGFAVFVSAIQREMNYPGTTVTAEFTEQNFQFMKEWNLVQGILNPDWVQTNNENIKAIYALNPITKEYVRFYPNPENSKIGETNYMWESFARIGALWIYSDKEFSSNYWKFEDSPVESTSLFAGWNFVAITPEMFYEKNEQDVFSWNGIKGNCNFEKIYAWNPEEQDWMPISPTQESSDFNDFLGSGMVVKVINDCNFGKSGDVIAPPSLPGTDDNIPPVDPNPTPTSDFPQNINTYSLADSRYEDKECVNNGDLCVEGNRAEYRASNSNKVIFVNFWDITSGTEAQLKELYANSNEGTLETINIGSNKLYRLENHELFWFTGKDYPAVIFTQEGTIIYNTDGYSYSYGTATGENEVTKKFLSLYPSQEVD